MINKPNNTYNTLIARELLPPPVAQYEINNKPLGIAIPALLSLVSALGSRAFLCLCLMAFTFFIASCQQEEVRTSGMQQLYQESQTLNQASLDSIDHFTAKLGKYINSHLSVLDDELYDPLISNVRKAYALHGYKAEVTMNVGIKINTDWEGIKFYSYDKDGNLTLDSVYTKEQLDSLGFNKGVID